MLQKIISKYISHYLDARVVFVLDMLMSMISATVVLLILNFFTSSGYYSGPFALWWLGGNFVFSALTMFCNKSYHVIVRYFTLRDVRQFVVGIFLTVALLGGLLAVACVFNISVAIALFTHFLLTLFLVLGARFVMVDVYFILKRKVRDVQHRQRILVYGTTPKSVSAISRFNNSNHYAVVGFLTPDPAYRNLQLARLPILTYKSEAEFRSLVERLSLAAVLFVFESDVKKEAQGLVELCGKYHVKTLISPSIDEMVGGKLTKGAIRPVKIEDLLGRPEIKFSLDEVRKNFQDKVVMVTGAAGSIGSELCRQLATFGVKELILYDNAETPMHHLRLELEERYPDLSFVPNIGSVRHEDRLDYAFRNWHPQIVFHAAAYKHVPLMEENPCEAVFANVYGSRMVADKCVEYGVEMMVMISTDKAVNPTNIMGCSKRLAEIYVQSLGLAVTKGEVQGKTKFVTTRFGNVLGSSGSVIPRFREQIEYGGPVTVTHPDINRYFMTIPEACRLVMEAATLSTGNQIFVFDMGESVKIADLARKMIELAGLKVGEDIAIEYTGLRPGEKLYEEVLANSENTEPTSHERIRIAKVREYDYQEVCREVDELTELSKAVRIPEMVKLMKKIVPEFKSQNSRFEEFDV